ncbi:MAG: GAF domain-containing protein [Actinobacteria bacterium]|nr:GAF domain-containing protein [Actinomycetota bacterium]
MNQESNILTELKKKNEELSLLYNISHTVSSSLDLNEVLNQIIDIVLKESSGDSIFLYLLDRQNKELVLRASKNPHPKMLGKIKLKIGEGITGWVAKENKPVAISENASDDPRFRFFHNLPEDRYQAFLSVPIINKGKVIGVINIQHKKSHEYSESTISLIKIIANQIGSAIENARLYEEMKRKALQVEALSALSKNIASNLYLKEILQLIVTMTAELLQSKICSIMLLSSDKKELIIEATQSLSQEYISKPNISVNNSISGRAALQKRPVCVLDVTIEPDFLYPEIARKEGFCSLLSVPMMVKEDIIGVINCYTEKLHEFSEEEIAIVQAVANQAAIAIKNTQLMEELVETKKALETRKVLEKAKGILMKELNVDENTAHKMIHKKSMDSCKPVKEIAEAIILAWEIKSK